MAVEILAFANYEFRVEKTSTKVIVGDRVQDEVRFALDWKDYSEYLNREGIDVTPASRPFFQRYQLPRPDTHFFDKFLTFQAEIRGMLKAVCETRTIPFRVWETVFREAENLTEIVTPVHEVRDDVSEEQLQYLEFEKRTSAETYRGFLLGELKDQIVDKRVFRMRKCPECSMFFMDNTRNGIKVYCSSASCGNRAKQRAFQLRKSQRENCGKSVGSPPG